MMNSVVEKLAAIEQEIAALQPKMAPLAERITALDQKVTGFAQQLTDLAAESVTIKQDIELTQQGLTRIQTLIGESKAESEHFMVGQEENLQRYKAMEAFVGTLYQLHSQSVEIAQWLGLASQAQAIFPALPAMPETLGLPAGLHDSPIPVTVVPPTLGESPVKQAPPGKLPEPPAGLPELPTPVAIAEPTPKKSPVEQAPPEELPEPPADLPELPIPAATVAEPIPKEPEQPTEKVVPAEESILSESDFDAAISDAGGKVPEPLAMPSLPNVAAPLEAATVPADAEDAEDAEDADTEPSDEIASHLDVPPLNLAVPALPTQNEPATAEEKEEEDIEAMLAAMGAPVTVGN